MVNLLPNYLRVSTNLCSKSPYEVAILRRGKYSDAINWRRSGRNARSRRTRSAGRVLQGSNSSSISVTEDSIGISEEIEGKNEILANGFGWKVRKLIEEEDDLKMVARIQAEAFHEPVLLFNDFFFQFFQAEVLSALIYRLKNYPPNRYVCLVAEPDTNHDDHCQFVGVVDATVAGDLKVRRHLPAGENEYLFVSGIAVSESFRRRKVGTVLLKGCEMIGKAWGLKYLALSAYEDDDGARNLYSQAGYEVISGDPLWISSWIGRKRCITMIKTL